MVECKVTVAGPVTQDAEAPAVAQAAARFVRKLQVVAVRGTVVVVADRHCSHQRMMMLSCQQAA